MRAEVVANREISASHFRMGLICSGLKADYEPGQFVMVRIGEGCEPLLRRPFSIHWMEGQYLELLYRVVGKGTQRMASLGPGQELDLLGPLGKGFRIPEDWHFALLVAGGMGVAPLRALAARLSLHAKPARVESQHRQRRICLLIGAKRAEEILCREDFERLGVQVLVASEDGSLGEKGMATDLLRGVLSRCRSEEELPSALYACGPRPMLARVAQMAGERGIACQVSLEEFMACGIGACMGCAVRVRHQESPYEMVCKDGPVFDARVIQW
ncbi:MAG: dihydroorotate dehydrogenase electron transfer subunit [candidate division NC10 bacterium]|nr:dihydroorotate dehydrogenase electron transfer subunit [candidate division NC10 bacterium]